MRVTLSFQTWLTRCNSYLSMRTSTEILGSLTCTRAVQTYLHFVMLYTFGEVVKMKDTQRPNSACAFSPHVCTRRMEHEGGTACIQTTCNYLRSDKTQCLMWHAKRAAILRALHLAHAHFFRVSCNACPIMALVRATLASMLRTFYFLQG